jgi:hypothetical protein
MAIGFFCFCFTGIVTDPTAGINDNLPGRMTNTG